MALIPIYCSNESCKHLGFVSVETLPRVLTCSSCGRQSLQAPPPVCATKDCQFAIGKWRSHPSLGREHEQYSVVGINRESVTVMPGRPALRPVQRFAPLTPAARLDRAVIGESHD
jgi:hypothetical protein